MGNARTAQRALMFIAALLAIGSMLAGSSAQAATYRVWTCKTDEGKVTSVEGWSEGGFAATTGQWATQDCASGGAVRIFMNGPSGWPGNTWKRWQWNAPTDTAIAHGELQINYSANWNGNDGIASPGFWMYHDQADYANFHGSCYSGNSPGGCNSWIGRFALDNVNAMGIVAGCIGDAFGRCEGGARLQADISYGLFDLSDNFAPQVGTTSGTVLDSGPLKGTKSLTWNATDRGGGIYQSEVKLDDTVVSARSVVNGNGGRCATVKATGDFGWPVPCPLAVSGEATINTALVADGQHTLRATVWDAAGNPATIVNRTVTIANAPVTPTPAKTPTPTPSAGTPTPTALIHPIATPGPQAVLSNNGTGGDPGSGRLTPSKAATSTTVKYGQSVVVSGKLVDAAGKPLASALVDVHVTSAGGARAKAATLTTDASGAWRWSAPARSNRTIEVGYSRERGSTDLQSTITLRVQVRARIDVQLTRSRIGARGQGELRGRVFADGLPTSGVQVQVQVRLGGAWSLAGLVRTKADGRFTWVRKFRTNRGTFPFRATLAKDPALPVLPSPSRTVTLRVG